MVENVTLVAYYGDKPAALRELIESTQSLLATLGPAFVPYALPQIHATIIGLEAEPGPNPGELFNLNYRRLRSEAKRMQLGAALEIAQRWEHWPLQIQLGGFRAEVAYPFQSRGQHPYLRSFSLQGQAAVAIGWPERPSALGELRRAFEAANVLHKYHATPQSLDNDLFFVLGRIEDARASEEVVHVIRERLAERSVAFELGPADLQLVHYRDASLPPATSRSVRLRDATQS